MSKNSEQIILVTGATGSQGGAVYQHLQRKGFNARFLNAEADYFNPVEVGCSGTRIVNPMPLSLHL